MTAVRDQVHAELVEVAPEVYAFTQLPGGWCLSNAGVIVTDERVILVDTLATERRAVRLREVVGRLPGGPRRTVINTHHHGDHVFGNHLFGPDTTIIGHENIVPELVDTGLALTHLWPDVDWGRVRVTLPTVTFSERLTLTAGDRRIELIHVGPAHTTNDVVVWLPDSRVLFAGDVLMSGTTPFSLMGSVAGSLAAIERLAGLGAEVIVCGHGPVAGPEVLAENAAYLTWVQELAEAGRRAGLTPLGAAPADLPEQFAHLLDSERLVGNLHRAYAELPGAEAARLDVPAVFGEMVHYNGGQLPTCLA